MSRKKHLARAYHFSKTSLVFVTSAILIGLGISVIWASTLKIPDFSTLIERRIAQSTKIFDRSGEVLLYDIHEDVRRKIVPIEEISRNIKNATLAIEDTDFYEHIGVKPTSILRAFIVNFSSGEVRQGGSTITQQVIKNSLLSNEKTISRKLKELVLTLKLEQVMSKDEILSLYLNESPYGGNLYGVEEASQSFFGKNANDVSLAEAAYLASLPKAPTYYSPYGPHRAELDKRKNIVLDRMATVGFLTKEEATVAKMELVNFLPATSGTIHAPHFVMMVKQYLENKYGTATVETMGLKVITSLDWDLQQKAEEYVTQYAEQNEKNFGADNAGMVGMDPKTGQVLVLVGSRNYFDNENDGNFNIATAKRQPGSAFKPFVYAAGFRKGFTPDTILFDLKTQFDVKCDSEGVPLSPKTKPESCYTPGNYDLLYRGPITVRNALAQSINIPAIKMLYLVGINDAIRLARNLGITTLTDASRYGLTLVLGGGEVTLLDMASAYGTFANDGIRNPYKLIMKVEDSNGKVLEEYNPEPTRILEENVARQISDILSDDKARAPIFGENSILNVPGRSVAAKTGTTNDYRDAWIIGYTPNFVLGAWVGNNDNSPMERKVAGYIVAPMWNAVMKEALSLLPEENFKKPTKDIEHLGVEYENLKPVLRGIWQGNNTYYIDTITGKLATTETPKETRVEKVIPEVHTILYWVDKSNPLGPRPEKPEDDPQFLLWEIPVQKWLATQNIQASPMPAETDNVHKTEYKPKISITSPTNTNYEPTDQIMIKFIRDLSATQNYPITEASYYLNGNFIGTSRNSPFYISFVPSELSFAREENEIKVIVFDSVRNSGEATATFHIPSL